MFGVRFPSASVVSLWLNFSESMSSRMRPRKKGFETSSFFESWPNVGERIDKFSFRSSNPETTWKKHSNIGCFKVFFNKSTEISQRMQKKKSLKIGSTLAQICSYHMNEINYDLLQQVRALSDILRWVNIKQFLHFFLLPTIRLIHSLTIFGWILFYKIFSLISFCW